MRYRRANTAGGTYFFTVNLAERSADTLVRHIDDLREVTRRVKETHPFSITNGIRPLLSTPSCLILTRSDKKNFRICRTYSRRRKTIWIKNFRDVDHLIYKKGLPGGYVLLS